MFPWSHWHIPGLCLALAIGYYYTFFEYEGDKDLLFGVYEAVDPSRYSEIYPDDAKPEIREIADLYTKLIMQFVDMRYLDAEDVHLPPHNSPRINNSHPARFGFTKDVVDMFQLVPYVKDYPNWNYGSDAGEFVMWGEFMADLRDNGDHEDMEEAWLSACIDPMYGIHHLRWNRDRNDPSQSSWYYSDGPYIKPWYAVLSSMGNHGSTMILDTKTYEMWLIEQIGGSTDPVFMHVNNGYKNTGVHVINGNDLAQYPSRPAKEFLQDIISRFKSLEWLPGGLYSDTDREFTDLKEFYIAAGWPDKWDPQKFHNLRQKWEQAKEDFWRATSPLEEFDREQRNSREGSPQWNKADWDDFQAELLERVVALRAEYDELLHRRGRFEGMSDESYQSAIEDGSFKKRLEQHEALLNDKDADSRYRRLLKEAHEASQKVPKDLIERWIAEQRKWNFKDAEWETNVRYAMLRGV